MKKLSFGVVILALSMACGSSPTSPTPPVATPPAPPIVSTPQMVSVTIRASRDVLYYPETAMLFADAHWDDGSSAPITPTWESSSSVVTLLANGPVAHAISQGAGSAVITARAAGLSATQTITINAGYRPRP
jgi:hypothetical protein